MDYATTVFGLAEGGGWSGWQGLSQTTGEGGRQGLSRVTAEDVVAESATQGTVAAGLAGRYNSSS